MKWLLIGLGTLAAVALIVVAVGAMLPKAHVATRAIRLHKTPEAVWLVISGKPDWRPEVVRTDSLPDQGGHAMWRETNKGGMTITYERMETDPPRRLVNRIADKTLPFGGGWTYAIDPEADGSIVRLTENGEVYNPLFRFVSRFIMGHASNIETALRSLAAHFGEKVSIER